MLLSQVLESDLGPLTYTYEKSAHVYGHERFAFLGSLPLRFFWCNGHALDRLVRLDFLLDTSL